MQFVREFFYCTKIRFVSNQSSQFPINKVISVKYRSGKKKGREKINPYTKSNADLDLGRVLLYATQAVSKKHIFFFSFWEGEGVGHQFIS